MRLLALMLGAGAALVTCHATPPAHEAKEKPTPAAVAPATSAPLPAPALASADDASAAAAPRDATPDATSLRCGAKRCRAGTETCCITSGGDVCVPSVQRVGSDSESAQAAQLEACKRAKLADEVVTTSGCDESGDCGLNELCCEQPWGSWGANVCLAPTGDGKIPCLVGERCVESSACRIPGSVCRDGYCKKPVAKLRCGKSICSSEQQACCGEPLACRPAAECGISRLFCTSPADCLPHEHCMLSMGSACTGLLELVNAFVVCERASDCPSDVCMWSPKARPRCIDKTRRGVKVCVCP